MRIYLHGIPQEWQITLMVRGEAVSRGCSNQNGGAGADGLYMQAPSITPGIIHANGTIGLGGSYSASSGGGGGGVVLMAYSTYLGSTSQINVTGGLVGTGSGHNNYGGNGQVLSYQYSTAPITNAQTFFINSNYALTSNLTINGNIVINGAVNLITNGYSLIATGAIINNGAIWTGNTLATSFTSSYGGSGGGAYNAGNAVPLRVHQH